MPLYLILWTSIRKLSSLLKGTNPAIHRPDLLSWPQRIKTRPNCLHQRLKQAFCTDIPFIKGIPEAPGAIPFYGHLKKLGNDHPTHFQNWALENQWPVFQAKLGNRRIVVLNTFAAAQEWMLKNASATVDRPFFLYISWNIKPNSR